MEAVRERQAVTERLEQLGSLAGRVQGAAKLAQLTENGAAFQQNLAAFVLPYGLRGGTPDAASGLFRQPVDRLVAVVLMLRNLGDATGDRAQDELEPLIDDVIGAIVGWGPEEAVGVFALASGELVSIAKGVVTYQLNFSLEDQLRIAR